jgi:predicted RNA-binding protein YlxR (DUF448 family)/ribosomal protein L30E
MIRFVVGPDDALVPDLAGRLPGRGYWLSADRRAVDGAVARNLFAKAARGRVTADPALADRLEGLLAERCLELVGLARRAGELVAGFDQVVAALRGGQAVLVLQARDGAADGRRKIASAAAARGGGGDGVPVVEAFGREELGRAIGRPEVVHVALASGGVGRRLQVELDRLKGFRELASLEAAGPVTEREEGLPRT